MAYRGELPQGLISKVCYRCLLQGIDAGVCYKVQKTRTEIVSSIKTGAKTISLLILSLLCFVLFLDAIMVVVRFVVGLAN